MSTNPNIAYFAQLHEGALAEWPIYEADLRARHPDRSLPADLSQGTPVGYVPVFDAQAPLAGRWQVVAEDPPALANGVWTRQWKLNAKPLTMQQKRDEVKADADRIAAGKRAQATAGSSPQEMASWGMKRMEALAYIASGNAADAPNLSVEAGERGIPLAALVGKVKANADQFTALEAAIAGRRGAIRDVADAAQTEAELLAIDLEAGWPF